MNSAESCIILMNIDSQKAQVDLSGYAGWKLAAALCADGGNVRLKDTTLNLPPWGIAILRPAA